MAKKMKMDFLNRYWWIAAATLVALGAVFYVSNPTPVSAVFDFNDGTVQGWTFDGVYDDAGKKYNGTMFPPKTLANFQGKEMIFNPNQLAVRLKQLGFPKQSAYWHVDIISPSLGPAWVGLKGIEAKVKDDVGIVDDVVEARVYLRYSSGGTVTEIPALAAFKPNLKHNVQTSISETLTVPAGAVPQNIVIRVRGMWATPNSPVIQAYEGAVHIDDVAKVN